MPHFVGLASRSTRAGAGDLAKTQQIGLGQSQVGGVDQWVAQVIILRPRFWAISMKLRMICGLINCKPMLVSRRKANKIT